MNWDACLFLPLLGTAVVSSGVDRHSTLCSSRGPRLVGRLMGVKPEATGGRVESKLQYQ